MDVHPPKNGMYRYWSIAISSLKESKSHSAGLSACFFLQSWSARFNAAVTERYLFQQGFGMVSFGEALESILWQTGTVPRHELAR